MMSSRWLRFILAIAAGIGLGLFIGWVVSPVRYVDTTPDSLSPDYQTDYVLMVAEAYHADGNLEQATQRLAVLGNQPPLQIAQQALSYAIGSNFPSSDVTLLSQLMQSLQTAAATPWGGS
jgi:hypothetical protein